MLEDNPARQNAQGGDAAAKGGVAMVDVGGEAGGDGNGERGDFGDGDAHGRGDGDAIADVFLQKALNLRMMHSD